MITSIELNNWKTHKQTRLEFQKGVNVLVGVMGAGKSSVMDAISFALFGTFPSLQHKRTSVEGIISEVSGANGSAEVKLSFSVGGDSYAVTRGVSRKGPSTATLEKNGKYLQAQPSKVTEEIASLLKLDYDTFSRAVYAEQNRIDYFLSLVKGDRKKQIDQMLGLDVFSRAEENATSLINSMRASVSTDTQTLSMMDMASAKAQLAKLSSERKAIEESQVSLAAQEKSLAEGIASLSGSISGMKARYERRKALSEEVSRLASKISTLKAEAEKIRLPSSTEEEMSSDEARKKAKKETLELRVKEATAAKDKAARALSDAEYDVRADERKAKEKEALELHLKGRTPASFEEKIKSLNSSINDLVSLHASSKSMKEDAEETLKELRRHTANCPVCDRTLSEELRAKLIGEKELAIARLSEAMSKAATSASERRKELKDVAEEQADVRVASSKLDAYSGLKEAMEKHLAVAVKAKSDHSAQSRDLEATAKGLESARSELAEASQKLEEFKRRKAYESEIEKASAQLLSKEDALKSVDVDEKALYSAQEELTKLSSMRSDVASKASGNERYLKGLDAQIGDKAKQIASLEGIAARIGRRRNQTAEMNKFRTALIETESVLRTRMVSSINGLMQNLWAEMYPYEDYAGIKLTAKKDDYALETSAGGANQAWVPVDAIASGGERSMACLAMRIALSMVIVPNLKWLILDEPTHNIDENGISKFVEVLGDSLPRVVEQVFIITHDNSLKQITSARVYQLDRDKRAHGPTSVSAL